MTLILKQIFAFLRILNSDTGHNQLAAGLALGVFLGFAPFFSLQTLLVFVCVFFFRVQLGAAFLSAFFFKFIAYILDPVADPIGRWALEVEFLRPFYVHIYNMPIIPFTQFNNSIVMGSLIISILLTPPLFFIFRSLIVKYRVLVVAQFKSTKVWKAFTATKFYNWYCTYAKLYL